MSKCIVAYLQVDVRLNVGSHFSSPWHLITPPSFVCVILSATPPSPTNTTTLPPSTPHSTILSLEFDEGGRHQEGEPLICWNRRLRRRFVLLKKEKERKKFILLLNWWRQTGLRAFSGKLLSETGWSCFVLTFCRKICVFFLYFWAAANLLLETLLPQHGLTVKIKVEQKWIIQHIYS